MAALAGSTLVIAMVVLSLLLLVIGGEIMGSIKILTIH